MRFVLAGVLAATLSAQNLDYEYFKTRVQPIFLNHRPGHARCYSCHSQGTPFRLQRLSSGASNWNDEQSRKNFTAAQAMINTSSPGASPLLMFPLDEKAGGNHFHPGGKHWESKSDPEWQTLSNWAHGRK